MAARCFTAPVHLLLRPISLLAMHRLHVNQAPVEVFGLYVTLAGNLLERYRDLPASRYLAAFGLIYYTIPK